MAEVHASALHLAAMSDYVFGMLIVVSNAILIAAFVRSKELHKKEFVLIGGVAVFDLCFGFNSFINGLHKHFCLLTNRNHQYTQLSLINFVVLSTRHFYPMVNLGYLCTTIDRVMAVIWFQKYLKFDHSYAYSMLAACASYGVVTLPYTAYMMFVKEVAAPYVNFLAALVCIVCAYLSVILYLVVCVGHRKMISNGTGANERQLKRQKRLNKTVGVLVLFTLFFDALPLTLMLFGRYIGQWKMICVSLTRVNCFVNVCYVCSTGDRRTCASRSTDCLANTTPSNNKLENRAVQFGDSTELYNHTRQRSAA